MSIGIYKITNPKGKIYIGQSTDVEKRENCYIKLNCKGQRILYNSIKKYGWEQHVFEIVEECKFEDLNVRERYWQDYYSVISKKGMNCLLTNTNDLPKIFSKETLIKRVQNRNNKIIGEKNSMKVYQINPNDLKIIKIWKSVSEIYRNGLKGIDGSFRNKKIYKGFIWVREIDYSEEYIKNNLHTFLRKRKFKQSPILQYDLEGNFIREWPSISEAERSIGGYISGAVRGRQKTAGGFIWKFK